jgi:hypothetical protein
MNPGGGEEGQVYFPWECGVRGEKTLAKRKRGSAKCQKAVDFTARGVRQTNQTPSPASPPAPGFKS